MTANAIYEPLVALSGLNVCALNQVTATLSVELSGAPVRFKIVVDNGTTMPPGAVQFIPAGSHDSFSFGFVQSVSPLENNDHHTFQVDWRSPTGKQVTLERGTLNLQYEKGTHGC